jgi:hypothetical protein
VEQDLRVVGDDDAARDPLDRAGDLRGRHLLEAQASTTTTCSSSWRTACW